MSPATRLATCSEPTSSVRLGTLVSECRNSSGSGRTVVYGPCVNGDREVIAGKWGPDVPRDNNDGDGRLLSLRCGPLTSRSPRVGCHQEPEVPEEEIASSGNL
jgi:hypothetical protein